jgi:enoyl-CoA hydratase/carnithine racemase
MTDATRFIVEDGIATLTLARPEALNAFNAAMHREFTAALDIVDQDDTIRALIVTGAGRAFCAGADLSDGAAVFDYGGDSEFRPAESPVRPDGTIDFNHPASEDAGAALALRLFRCLKPIIAAVNGPAFGIGATMTLPMDIRLASENARFGFVFSRIGIVPESASSWFLPRIVGISRALEWCIGGLTVSAAEAQAAGLVRDVLPAEDLLPAARELARKITESSAPVSVALSRQMLWRMLTANHPVEASRLDSQLLWSRGTSVDVPEGVAASKERRKPQFTARVSTDLPRPSPWFDDPAYSRNPK